MGLLDSLQSGDPVANRGLMDFGLALLSSRGNFGNALGRAGLAGLQGADEYRMRLEALKRAELNDEALRMQVQQMRDQQRMQEYLQAAARRNYQTPQQQALGAGGGPTVANAQAAEGMPGGLNVPRFVAEVSGEYPLTGMDLAQKYAKQSPQPLKLGEGDVLVDPRTYKPVASNPKSIKPADLPNAVQEYQFAQGQGYKGTFNDWVKEKARAGASSTTVSYGAPVAGVDAQGNPVYFQPAKGGGAPAIVPGVMPPPNPAELKRVEEAKQAKQSAIDKASTAYKTIDAMLKHPGLDTTIGVSGQLDPRNYVWGTSAQGAKALVEQAQGQAFLQAFESLKGGGQITQVEGEKATAAIARLQRSQNPKDFRAAANELKGIAAKAYERAAGKPLASGGETIRYDEQGNRLP